MHGLRQLKAEISIHNEGNAALPGLGINADNRLIFPSDIGRIDRQIRYLPNLAVPFLHRLYALINGILVGT